MKALILGALVVVTSIAGCSSTNNDESSGKQMTTTELDKIASNSSFTSKQLRDAAKELGYRCDLVAKTGSHMKKKLCSTQQQRDVMEAAARQRIRDMEKTGITAANQHSNGG